MSGDLFLWSTKYLLVEIQFETTIRFDTYTIGEFSECSKPIQSYHGCNGSNFYFTDGSDLNKLGALDGRSNGLGTPLQKQGAPRGELL